MKKFIVLGSVLLLLTGVILLFLLNKSSLKQQKLTIGLINPNPGTKKITQGFIDGLASYGYVEGENLSYIKCEQKEQIPTVLALMKEKEVDLIFAVTTPATRQAKKIMKGTGIPIIFTMHDPIASGIISNLANPSENITGVQIRGSVEKSVEWLLQFAPDTKHIFVPIRYDTKAAEQSLTDFKIAASKVDVKLTVAEVQSKEELYKTLTNIPADVDSIFILHSIFISKMAEDIAQFAIDRKILLGCAIGKTDDGALFSFSPELDHMGRKASRMAQQVLQGESPQNIPAEIADFYLTVNLKVAEKIGLVISNDILLQADKIIR